MTPRRKATPRRHLRPVPAADHAAGPPWRVLWHPDAVTERDQIKEAADRVAIEHAQEKLVAAGPQLQFPHQSAVKGADGKGMRELRPRRGSCAWRPIYRQATFVVVAVAPEAKTNGQGFDAAIARARARFEKIKL